MPVRKRNTGCKKVPHSFDLRTVLADMARSAQRFLNPVGSGISRRIRRAVAPRVLGPAASLPVLAGCLAVALSTPAAAEDIEIVIDRGADSVEVYMAMNAATMTNAFGLPPTLLADEHGLVDIEPLRQGTWQIGDALLANVETRLDDAPAVFEAMSLMVHPADSPLPLDTPIDGMVAIAVCTVPTPETHPGLSELRAYVGFIAYPVDPEQIVSFSLPESGRQPLDITVRDFKNGQLVASSTHKVADGGTLTIVTAGAAASWLGFVALAGLGVTGLGASVALLRYRRRTATVPPASGRRLGSE